MSVAVFQASWNWASGLLQMGELIGYPNFAKSLLTWQVSPRSASLTSVKRLLELSVWRLTSTFSNLTSEIGLADINPAWTVDAVNSNQYAHNPRHAVQQAPGEFAWKRISIPSDLRSASRSNTPNQHRDIPGQLLLAQTVVQSHRWSDEDGCNGWNGGECHVLSQLADGPQRPWWLPVSG